jgi:hypothetical protein
MGVGTLIRLTLQLIAQKHYPETLANKQAYRSLAMRFLGFSSAGSTHG